MHVKVMLTFLNKWDKSISSI